MYFARQTSLFSIGFLVVTCIAAPQEEKRQETCSVGFNLCPAAATSSGTSGSGTSSSFTPGALGPSSYDFITSIGSSVSAAASKRALRKRDGTLCCNETLECRILTDYSLYICYDNNNADYYLIDGSNGNAQTGMFYDAADDSNMNLFTGDYVYPNGTRGNVYDNSDLPRPTVTAEAPEATGNVASQAKVEDDANSDSSSTTASSTPTATSGTSSTSSTSASSASASASAANTGSVLAVPDYKSSTVLLLLLVPMAIGGLLL